jgi:hypothetical protein
MTKRIHFASHSSDAAVKLAPEILHPMHLSAALSITHSY